MPNPYRARVDVRRFLNLPGFHGGAYVVAYVEDTSSRELTKRDPLGYEGSRYFNPQPRIILEIADCSERVNLEFELDSDPTSRIRCTRPTCSSPRSPSS